MTGDDPDDSRPYSEPSKKADCKAKTEPAYVFYLLYGCGARSCRGAPELLEEAAALLLTRQRGHHKPRVRFAAGPFHCGRARRARSSSRGFAR